MGRARKQQHGPVRGAWTKLSDSHGAANPAMTKQAAGSEKHHTNLPPGMKKAYKRH